MASDTPPPADHSAMFSDPAELARYWNTEANNHWARACACAGPACDSAYLRAIYRATFYRRMAARGERVPEF